MVESFSSKNKGLIHNHLIQNGLRKVGLKKTPVNISGKLILDVHIFQESFSKHLHRDWLQISHLLLSEFK